MTHDVNESFAVVVDRGRKPTCFVSRIRFMEAKQTIAHFSSDDFERWLALQHLLGWRVRNPETVEKIRAAFRRGANLTVPVLEIVNRKS